MENVNSYVWAQNNNITRAGRERPDLTTVHIK